MAKDVEWIKLTTDMFDNRKIKELRRLPDGDKIVLIWVMLLTMAGKCNAGGMIIISENIPYTVEGLADDLKFEPNTVKLAIASFERMGMIYTENDCFVISNWYEYQNKDGLEKIREQTRLRTAKYRERKKIECDVTCDATVTQESYSYSISNSNSSSCSFSKDIEEIIDYLNIKTNSKYTYKNKSYNKKITARLNDGFTVEDFKSVIDKKCDEWLGTEYEQYLTPDTLFAPSKFEKYLNQPAVKKSGTDTFIDKWANA